MPLGHLDQRSSDWERHERPGDRQMVRLAAAERDVLIVTCAISAGVHAALVREHFAEGAGAGGGFLASIVLLAGLVIVLSFRPPTASSLLVACAVLSGLLVSYALAITTGVPVLHPDVEPVEGLALVTKAIEAVGLLVGLHMLQRRCPAVSHPRPTQRNIA